MDEERRKVRPGSGMPFGAGYFEDVDAEEICDLVEGKIDPADVIAQDEAKSEAEGLARRLVQAGHNFADAINDLSGVMESKGGGGLTDKTKKLVEKTVKKVDNAMTTYGHEILPKLK